MDNKDRSQEQGFPDGIAKGAQMPGTRSPGVAPGEVASLMGESGKEVAMNLGRLSAGLVSVETLGSAYYLTTDGALGLRVDKETFDKLP